jgi:uracil phosphoribosyltransferase
MDKNYLENLSSLNEVKHLYPSNVHLLSSPYTHQLLSFIGSPNITQPLLGNYMEWAYLYLLQAALNSPVMPKKIHTVPTRMEIQHPIEAQYSFQGLDDSYPLVMVDVARAGTFPAQVCYQHLNHLFSPAQVRQDHIYMNRKTDSDGVVIGQTFSGSKIGGPVERSIMFIPDPMGATGGTMARVLKHYQEAVSGTPHMIFALHLMITPEYIERMKQEFPQVQVFALRCDRGLSSERALASIPGQFEQEERGLNKYQYVVPGAGGVGEVLNNSFV